MIRLAYSNLLISEFHRPNILREFAALIGVKCADPGHVCLLITGGDEAGRSADCFRGVVNKGKMNRNLSQTGNMIKT